MKLNHLSFVTYQSLETALCWSPVANTPRGSQFNSNMIEAGKDYGRVQEGWDD
jgi:hypothetical protein